MKKTCLYSSKDKPRKNLNIIWHHVTSLSPHADHLVQAKLERKYTWRERVIRMRMRITLIFDNFPQYLTFCKIFTSKFHSVYTDCRRLLEIVKDSACTFRKLLKIACPIVKDGVSLVLVLATHFLRLILHQVHWDPFQGPSLYCVSIKSI